jgi:DNA modification methylase
VFTLGDITIPELVFENDACLMLGDCLEKMRSIPDKSIDMAYITLPYGITGKLWDTPIALDLMQMQLNRIMKDGAAAAFLMMGEYTKTLLNSNKKYPNYEYHWIKSVGVNSYGCATRPSRRRVEKVYVWHMGKETKWRAYNPQRSYKNPYSGWNALERGKTSKTGPVYGSRVSQHKGSIDGARWPTDILYGPSDTTTRQKSEDKHDSANPMWLAEYNIRTFSNPGDVVIDITMGGGSTGIAAKNCGRKFIGIELDPVIFNAAKKKIDATYLGSNTEYEKIKQDTNNFSQEGELLRTNKELVKKLRRYQEIEEQQILAYLETHPEGATCKELSKVLTFDGVFPTLQRLKSFKLVRTTGEKVLVWTKYSNSIIELVTESYTLAEPSHDGDNHGITQRLVPSGV